MLSVENQSSVFIAVIIFKSYGNHAYEKVSNVNVSLYVLGSPNTKKA